MPAVIVTLHSLAPTMLSQPLQTATFEPELAVATRITSVPSAKAASVAGQPTPQLIPAGVLATVPAPAPALISFRL